MRWGFPLINSPYHHETVMDAEGGFGARYGGAFAVWSVCMLGAFRSTPILPDT